MNGFVREDFEHTAKLLRSENDQAVRATFSNNFNIILAALDQASLCCRAQPRPGVGLGDGKAFPEQLVVMEGIVERLRYDLPVQDLVMLMKSAGSSLDNRPRFGNDIMRCIIHNGAERLEMLSSKIDTRPWRTWRQRIADAWAVFRERAQAIYVSGTVYDRR